MVSPSFATFRFPISLRTYRLFEGPIVHTMQRLLTGQEHGVCVDTPRLPLSPKQLMKLRLGSIGAEGDHILFRDMHAGTNMAVLHDPYSNAVKYARDHPLLYTLTPETRLVHGRFGNFPLTKEQYDHSDGFVFTADESETLQNGPHALPKRREAFWEYAAEGDTILTKDYITYVTQQTKLSFDQAMGLYLLSHEGLGCLFVDRIVHRSSGDSSSNLGFEFGCLAGVATEPHVVAQKIANAHAWKKSLENIVT